MATFEFERILAWVQLTCGLLAWTLDDWEEMNEYVLEMASVQDDNSDPSWDTHGLANYLGLATKSQCLGEAGLYYDERLEDSNGCEPEIKRWHILRKERTVEMIRDHRLNAEKKRRDYLVKWEGTSEAAPTWEPTEQIPRRAIAQYKTTIGTRKFNAKNGNRTSQKKVRPPPRNCRTRPGNVRYSY